MGKEHKTFKDIVAEAEAHPLLALKPKFNTNEAMRAPNGDIYRYVRGLEDSEANELLGTGVPAVIDDCGSLGFVGFLDWRKPYDDKYSVVPPLRKLKKRESAFYLLAEYVGPNDERVVVIGGPFFAWPE